MSMSLRDQLLQAGLINKKQAQQASQERHKQKLQQSKNPSAAADEAKLAAQRALAEKVAQDQARNRQAQEKAELKARKAQVKQLVEQNRLPKIESDEFYNFIDGKKIRRIPVNAQMRVQLGQGQVAIVRCEGRYEMVPATAVERIRERDERAVVFHNTGPGAIDDNDPYKDYTVPDDLIW